jgi:3-phenylpropionate/trans-cinnamate dioxygenase ferredoxin reductase subunit
VTGPDKIVIVGASAAGVSAARTLRAEGFSGNVVLIDADPNPPYERPPLSKHLLEIEGAVCGDYPLLSREDAESLDLDLRLGQRVDALDPEGSVTIEGGETIAAHGILIATGGKARRLPLPGADLAGVHVIRCSADVEALKVDLRRAGSVAVVGGGLIGTEAALAMLRSGRQVTWIDAAERPLSHIYPELIASHLVASHIAQGLSLRAAARLTEFVDRQGRVAGLRFADGEVLEVDLVVLGVGMAPNDGLARRAGLEVSDGVNVDADQRTSAPRVYAAGDVAAVLQQDGARQRHEHWRAAEHQGAAAARAMLGLEVQPAPPAWFWSDQGVHHVETAGRRTGDLVVRPGGRGPIVFEMDGDLLAGATTVDEPNAVRAALRLIQSRRPVARDRLADPNVDLKELLRG